MSATASLDATLRLLAEELLALALVYAPPGPRQPQAPPAATEADLIAYLFQEGPEVSDETPVPPRPQRKGANDEDL